MVDVMIICRTKTVKLSLIIIIIMIFSLVQFKMFDTPCFNNISQVLNYSSNHFCIEYQRHTRINKWKSYFTGNASEYFNTNFFYYFLDHEHYQKRVVFSKVLKVHFDNWLIKYIPRQN